MSTTMFKMHNTFFRDTLVLAASIFSLSVSSTWALPYTVTMGTPELTGTSAQLAFDFLDGGPPSNIVTISDFVTDGTLGSSSSSGGVIGDLPGTVTLSDTAFLNEYLKNITLGSSFSFVLNATGNTPSQASFPDAFSMFLLNPSTGLSLVTTDDPTGSDALALLSIDGSATGTLEIFSTSITVTTTAVPEPTNLLLLLTGVSFLLAVRRKYG